MTNIEKLALDICRMKHQEKVLAALEVMCKIGVFDHMRKDTDKEDNPSE